MNKVFISYSRKDIQIAERLHKQLHDLGLQVWWDKREIILGEDWRREIDLALSDNEFMLLLVSPDSLLSPHVEYEWQQFLGQAKPVFPLLIREVATLPQELERIQHIPITHEHFDDDFTKLFEMLQAQGVEFRLVSDRADLQVSFLKEQNISSSSVNEQRRSVRVLTQTSYGKCELRSVIVRAIRHMQRLHPRIDRLYVEVFVTEEDQFMTLPNPACTARWANPASCKNIPPPQTKDYETLSTISDLGEIFIEWMVEVRQARHEYYWERDISTPDWLSMTINLLPHLEKVSDEILQLTTTLEIEPTEPIRYSADMRELSNVLVKLLDGLRTTRTYAEVGSLHEFLRKQVVARLWSGTAPLSEQGNYVQMPLEEKIRITRNCIADFNSNKDKLRTRIMRLEESYKDSF